VFSFLWQNYFNYELVFVRFEGQTLAEEEKELRNGTGKSE
jgi:hypothetical protein